METTAVSRAFLIGGLFSSISKLIVEIVEISSRYEDTLGHKLN